MLYRLLYIPTFVANVRTTSLANSKTSLYVSSRKAKKNEVIAGFGRDRVHGYNYKCYYHLGTPLKREWYVYACIMSEAPPKLNKGKKIAVSAT